jgi:hypothetical protein
LSTQWPRFHQIIGATGYFTLAAQMPQMPRRRASSGAGGQIAQRKAKGSTGGRPPAFNAAVYALRNTVERGFNRLKQWRGIATRYDKYPDLPRRRPIGMCRDPRPRRNSQVGRHALSSVGARGSQLLIAATIATPRDWFGITG